MLILIIMQKFFEKLKQKMWILYPYLMPSFMLNYSTHSLSLFKKGAYFFPFSLVIFKLFLYIYSNIGYERLNRFANHSSSAVNTPVKCPFLLFSYKNGLAQILPSFFLFVSYSQPLFFIKIILFPNFSRASSKKGLFSCFILIFLYILYNTKYF